MPADELRSQHRERLSPELRLLLCCARLQVDAPRAEQIASILAGPVNWEQVLAAATRHGLAPLLCRHLVESRLPGVPAFACDSLKRSFQRTTLQNLKLLRELFDLLDLLHANQVPAVPYKGPLMAELLYGHPGLRPSRDLDILVPRPDVALAVELMGERHYLRREQPQVSDDELADQCEVELRRADGGIVEIHWAILPKEFSIHLESTEIWQGLIAPWIQGRRIAQFSPEMLLPILCVHGAKHLWRRLSWLCDVSLVAERLCDWELSFDLAQRMGGRRMLLLGLELASDLLGTSPPRFAQEAVRADSAVAGLARTVRAGLEHGSGDPGFLQTHRFMLATREHKMDRIRYLSCLACRRSPVDRAFVALPPALEFLYPGVRAMRIGIRVASEAVASLRRR